MHTYLQDGKRSDSGNSKPGSLCSGPWWMQQHESNYTSWFIDTGEYQQTWGFPMRAIILQSSLSNHCTQIIQSLNFDSSKWCSSELHGHSGYLYITIDELGAPDDSTQEWHYHYVHHQYNISRWKEHDTDGLFKQVFSFGVPQTIYFIHL